MAETIISYGENPCALHTWIVYSPPENNYSRECSICGELRADFDAIRKDTSICWYCGKWDYDVRVVDSVYIECTCKNCGQKWERAVA